MAHRRAVPRHWRGVWLLIPLALALDAATALSLNVRTLPFRMVVPEVVLLAAPVVVYGALAFFTLRTWPPAWRVGAAVALLSVHAGLVALHTVAYVVLWSFPAPAALRLAHRWSPLVPLLQLLWVPLLALPLAIQADRRRRPAPPPPRRVPTRIPVEVLLARASRAGPQARPQPKTRIHVEPPRPDPVPDTVSEAAAVATALEPAPPPPLAPSVPPGGEATASPCDAPAPSVSETAPEAIEVVVTAAAVPSRESAPIPAAPTWFDELLVTSARNVPPEESRSAPARDAYVIEDATPIQSPEPVTERREPEVAPEPVETIAPVSKTEVVSSEPLEPAPAVLLTATDALADDLEHRASAAPASEATVASMAIAKVAPRIVSPPLDLDLVARVFAPYGPLLSRDREVQVDWTPGRGVPLVCVVPRDMSRDRVARLAALMLAVGEGAAEPIRRLSLRDPEGVIVLTSLDGAVLATASRRPGAMALLEALSARLVPAADDGAAGGQAQNASGTGADPGPDGVRVETAAAALEVFAPTEMAAVSIGELMGRLLAALAAESGGRERLQDLTVGLRAHRVVVQPIHPAGCAPRFVVVVGGPQSPGLLGRQAERAARAFRLAS
jgi:hypothetical protein